MKIKSFFDFITEELQKIKNYDISSKSKKFYDVILDDPSSASSPSSAILLKKQLRDIEDEETLKKLKDISQMTSSQKSKYFKTKDTKDLAIPLNNLQFLKDKQKEIGTLRCEYCNKGPLKIYDFNPDNLKLKDIRTKYSIYKRMKFDPKDGATADHKQPMSKGGDMFDYSNLAVCCSRCNGRKGNMSWDEWINTMKIRESFSTEMKGKLYVEFNGTSDHESLLSNSWTHFRNSGHKRINPPPKLKEKVEKIVLKYLDNKIDNFKWEEDFKQFYFYMWSNKEHMSYNERELSNKKALIIDFYDDNWIFCSLINRDVLPNKETHFVCDDIEGLEEFLKEKSDFIKNKQFF